MASTCKTCNSLVTGIENLACRGKCGSVFHRACVQGLQRSTLDMLATFRGNLFWLCDDCAGCFTKWVQQPEPAPPAADTIKLGDSVVKLTDVVSDLSNRIQQLFPSGVSSATQWSLFSQRRQGEQPTPKRSRENAAKIRATTAAVCGTRSIQREIKTVADEREQLWIYVSRLDPSHTTEDISEMAKECLGTSELPKAVLLVKKDADISKLNFVSFRVEVPMELKDAALEASTWPTGVLVREFDFDQGRGNRFPH